MKPKTQKLFFIEAHQDNQIIMCKNGQKPKLKVEPCCDKSELWSQIYTHKYQDLPIRSHFYEKEKLWSQSWTSVVTAAAL